MRLSEAVQGFLMWRAVAGSAHTARDYANTLRQFEAFVEDDPEVAAVDADQVRRFLYWLRVERELAPDGTLAFRFCCELCRGYYIFGR